MFVAFFCINGRSSSHKIKRVSLLILRFSRHSYGVTSSATKLSPHALVRPGLTQNLLSTGVFLDDFALKIDIEIVKVLSNLRLLL